MIVCRQGFTFIELLVVIVIIVILITLISTMPFVDFPMDKMTKCKHNLKVLYQALVIYVQENNNVYPQASGVAFWNALRTGSEPLLKPKDYKRFICPVKGGDPGFNVCDYKGPVYNVDWNTPDRYPLAADKPTNHHPKGKKPINVLYFNSDIRKVKPGTPEWNQTLPEAKLLTE